MASFSSYAKEFSKLFLATTNNIISARSEPNNEIIKTINDQLDQLTELV